MRIIFSTAFIFVFLGCTSNSEKETHKNKITKKTNSIVLKTEDIQAQILNPDSCQNLKVDEVGLIEVEIENLNNQEIVWSKNLKSDEYFHIKTNCASPLSAKQKCILILECKSENKIFNHETEIEIESNSHSLRLPLVAKSQFQFEPKLISNNLNPELDFNSSQKAVVWQFKEKDQKHYSLINNLNSRFQVECKDLNEESCMNPIVFQRLNTRSAIMNISSQWIDIGLTIRTSTMGNQGRNVSQESCELRRFDKSTGELKSIRELKIPAPDLDGVTERSSFSCVDIQDAAGITYIVGNYADSLENPVQLNTYLYAVDDSAEANLYAVNDVFFENPQEPLPGCNEGMPHSQESLQLLKKSDSVVNWFYRFEKVSEFECKRKYYGVEYKFFEGSWRKISEIEPKPAPGKTWPFQSPFNNTLPRLSYLKYFSINSEGEFLISFEALLNEQRKIGIMKLKSDGILDENFGLEGISYIPIPKNFEDYVRIGQNILLKDKKMISIFFANPKEENSITLPYLYCMDLSGKPCVSSEKFSGLGFLAMNDPVFSIKFPEFLDQIWTVDTWQNELDFERIEESNNYFLIAHEQADKFYFYGTSKFKKTADSDEIYLNTKISFE